MAATGEAIRFQQGSEAMGRFFDVYATHIGPGCFVVLFTDITACKQAANTGLELIESTAR